jgi:hypothetical protein
VWITINRRTGRRPHLDQRRSRASVCLRRDELSPAATVVRWPLELLLITSPESHCAEVTDFGRDVRSRLPTERLLFLSQFLGKQLQQHCVAIFVARLIALALGYQPPVVLDVCIMDETLHSRPLLTISEDSARRCPQNYVRLLRT